jgi:hypothetical protein
VREWTRAALLTPDQAKTIDADLQTPLRRTGIMLRLGLAIFTFVGVFGAIGLTFLVFELRNDRDIAVLALLAGLLAFAAADWIVARFHFYRHGVEEALSVCSVGFMVIGVVLALSRIEGWSESRAVVIALATGAAISAACYLRFGFQYAAVASMVWCAAVILPVDDMAPQTKRIVGALVFGAFFTVARILRTRVGSEVLEDDAEAVAAGALAGIYLSLNLQLTPDWGQVPAAEVRWFWWGSYASIWAIPAAALWRAVLDRDRTLLRVALTLGLATLVTNKPYLGWPRQTWDPMLLGVVLMGGALLVGRWLASGRDGQRGVFTPARVLPSEDAAVQLAGLASAAIHMQPGQTPPSAPPAFGSGRSGGGGASGHF